MRHSILFLILLFVSCSLFAVEYPDFSAMSDDAMLDTIERKTLDFFLTEVNSGAYLTHDRAKNFSTDNNDSVYAPIASGFGMIAICIAHRRGWISKQDAYDRIYPVLNYFLNAPENAAPSPTVLVQNKGFFYHYLDSGGKRTWTSELSTIDTAFFAAGALFAGQYFKQLDGDTTLWNKADQIYRRIDWDWMLAGNNYLDWGWNPEFRFSEGEISGFSEGIFAYILAMGSPTHPLIDSSGWAAINRDTTSYKNLSYIYEKGNNSLFAYQYPGLLINFAGKRDAFACYAENTYKATLHNHLYVYDNRSLYETYGQYSWGLGASDDVDGGYTMYGNGHNEDGTISIANLMTAISELPGPVISSIRYLYDNYKSELWGNYGFCESYNSAITKSSAWNLPNMWRDPEIIGIQSGAAMFAIENYRTGFVRDTFSSISYVQNGLSALGFASDNIAPAKVTGLIANTRLNESKTSAYVYSLQWISPGDDNYSIDISSGLYEIRFSTNAVDSWEKSPPNYLYYDSLIRSTGTVAGSAQSVVLTSLSGGDYLYFRVKAADKYFNWSPESDQLTVYLGTSPIISPRYVYQTLLPSYYEISGHEFEDGAGVSLVRSGEQDIPAQGAAVINRNKIGCSFGLASKTTGYWDIVVTTGGAGSTYFSPSGFEIRPMSVDSITPAYICNNTPNSQPFTITGQGFIDGATVIFTASGQNSINADDVTVESSTTITCKINPGAIKAGYGNIIVSAASFTAELKSALEIKHLPPLSFSSLKIYPNPYSRSTNAGGIVLSNFPADPEVKIYNIAGEIVKDFGIVSGNEDITWDMRNNSGSLVASGIYILSFKSPAGSAARKIAIK